jgi:SHS2 domain-containing protein
MDPLEQRTNSRRAARINAQEAVRRPAPSIEAQIEAAIESRRNQRRFASCNDEDESDASNDTSNDAPYEFLDHTADIQLHAWGETFNEALANSVVAMFDYMTHGLQRVEIDEQETAEYGQTMTVTAHDAESLVFNLLQTWLERFYDCKFIPKSVSVKATETDWCVSTSGEGETFKPHKHRQGTEVKAVTYSNLQVREMTEDGATKWHVWVIVDI